jgi:hypothetical protein
MSGVWIYQRESRGLPPSMRGKILLCDKVTPLFRPILAPNSPGNLPILRIVAAGTLKLILLAATACAKSGKTVSAPVECCALLDWHATVLPGMAHAAAARNIRLRVCIWVASFQSFYWDSKTSLLRTHKGPKN